MAKTKTEDEFREIELELIDRPETIVRMAIDESELEELVNSIRERGLRQPIEVAPREGRFKIAFGDRRYLAHKILKKKTIMCRVVELSDKEMVIDRAIENDQRVNLTPFEKAHQYHDLLERGEMKISEISKRMGKSSGVIQRYLSVLRMPESFQKAIHSKKVNMTVAEELWRCPSADKREYFIVLAIEHGITAAIARQWVDDFQKEERTRKSGSDQGRGDRAAFEAPIIYRACDVCKDPVEYKDLKELRVCPKCHKGILDVLEKR
ncbi:MAG: ParB/RepB/Spo0J family partition protein [Desulfobacteraceae bacterium]|nr:ParB/RepB/Spo0J family partition protein [Desulfobacteraceae bacterium]